VDVHGEENSKFEIRTARSDRGPKARNVKARAGASSASAGPG
jgi:hypothetical protein